MHNSQSLLMFGHMDGPIRLAAAMMAKKYAIHLVAGTIPVCDNPDDVRPYAASFLYDPQGQEIGRYNKVHLFDASVQDAQQSYRESDTYQPGTSTVCVDTALGRIGFAVCYDLRFPEMFRLLFQKQPDIIVLPSAFTQVTGEAHWMPLLQARAIENQCFIVAANQGGKHSSTRETFGHSAVYSPWGDLLALIDKGEGMAIAEFESEDILTLRQELPVAEHQRFFVNPSINS